MSEFGQGFLVGLGLTVLLGLCAVYSVAEVWAYVAAQDRLRRLRKRLESWEREDAESRRDWP